RQNRGHPYGRICTAIGASLLCWTRLSRRAGSCPTRSSPPAMRACCFLPSLMQRVSTSYSIRTVLRGRTVFSYMIPRAVSHVIDEAGQTSHVASSDGAEGGQSAPMATQSDSNFDGNSRNRTRRNRAIMRLAADSVIDLRTTFLRQKIGAFDSRVRAAASARVQ